MLGLLRKKAAAKLAEPGCDFEATRTDSESPEILTPSRAHPKSLGFSGEV